MTLGARPQGWASQTPGFLPPGVNQFHPILSSLSNSIIKSRSLKSRLEAPLDVRVPLANTYVLRRVIQILSLK
jgi:hypothetical protein